MTRTIAAPLRAALRAKLIYLLTLASLAFPGLLFAQDCPALPYRIASDAEDQAFVAAWQQVAEPYLARYAMPDGSPANYGVGYLRMDFSTGNYFGYYDWVLRLELPLWQTPDSQAFYGWARQGRVYPASGNPFPISGAGLVETEYELSNLIVYETIDDGWLSIRLGGEGTDSQDLWTHRCHLDLGEVDLQYSAWEAFIREHGEWLHFRRRVPHGLFAAPEATAEAVTRIGLDHKLEMLEVRGDWMRVLVTQPDLTCTGEPDDATVSRQEGWVQWRDADTGPRTWVYTRGC